MIEADQAVEQRQRSRNESLASVAPAGAFHNSDLEPTAYAVGYVLPLLRSFRRNRNSMKPRFARGHFPCANRLVVFPEVALMAA